MTNTPASSLSAGNAPCPSPTPALDDVLIVRLRSDLTDAAWFVGDVDELLSEAARGALMRDQRTPAVVELVAVDPTSPDHARAVLTRLFMLGSSELASDVDAALPTLGVRGALALGLIDEAPAAPSAPWEDATLDGPRVKAAFDLRPHEASLPTAASYMPEGDPDERADHHWWVLSDLGEATTGQPLHRDHVLGIGGATMNLLSLTVRQPVASALDIGTGCGIQALYLSTHAETVVATDISARAVQITRFNAALNECQIDVREGSLFEPVDGQRFDLIVSNPPFVITPDSLREGGLMEYRDGGMQRDSLIETIIRQAPNYLNDGGVMQMLGNWEVSIGQDVDLGWSARVEHWLADLPVDAWVLQRDLLDPTQYVEMWLRDSGGTLQARDSVEAAYAAWIGDFAQAGVGHIGMGSLAMRRTTAAPQRHYDYLPGGHAPTGADVARALEYVAVEEQLTTGASRKTGTTLWDEALLCRGDVTEERHHTPGSPDPSAIILHQGGGMGRSFRVGSNTSAFVGACDGDLTVGQIADAIAVITDQDATIVREEIASLLPDLLRSGMLTRRKTQ